MDFVALELKEVSFFSFALQLLFYTADMLNKLLRGHLFGGNSIDQGGRFGPSGL